MSHRFVIGVDIGGTNIKFGCVDGAGKIKAQSSLPTTCFLSHKNKLIEAILDEIQNLIQKNGLNKKDIQGIGLGWPGLIDAHQGVVKVLPNIPGWKNVPFKAIAEKRMAIPTYIDNDVKLITLGEWKFGAGRGCQNLVCLTLGTGVGSGLVLNNQLYRGASFTAGELGHIPLNEKGPRCNCGGIACFERYVGNKYLQERAQKLFKNKNIRLEEVDQLANEGHKLAIKFWEEMASHIGVAMVTVVNLLNPERIIFGGGIARASRHFFPVVKKIIHARAFKIPANAVRLVQAKLGDTAGILGAKVLVDGSC